MTHETTYGRIKLEIRVEYNPYISETERDEIIRDIESFVNHRAGGYVKVRDINHEPDLHIREGFGSYFVSKPTFSGMSEEIAITK